MFFYSKRFFVLWNHKISVHLQKRTHCTEKHFFTVIKGVDKGGAFGAQALSVFYEIIKKTDNSFLKLNLQFKFRFKSNFIRVTRKRHYRYKLFKVS